ncbi:MAG: helix-turn-helix domain-containing protein [Planctomycetaceae bacterium]|nr:helix-turn-helix domain-containing protein [Planctomycetaceae bacterium]
MAAVTKTTKSSRAIGMRLKKWRKKNSLTQAQAGKIYGCSGSQWSFLERGNNAFDCETIGRLAKKTGLDAGYILTGKTPGGAPGGNGTILLEQDELALKYAALLARLVELGPSVYACSLGNLGESSEIAEQIDIAEKLIDGAADALHKVPQLCAERDTVQSAG